MTLPRVSILMPVYNAAAYIGQALASMLFQTFGDFECLVVDDGSTDESLAIVAAVEDSRVAVVRQPHRGLPRTLNEGLARARGEYVARLDADDWSDPDRLHRQVEFLDTHPEVMLVGSGIVLTDKHGRGLKRYLYPAEHEALAKELRQGVNPLPHSSIMYRREAVVKAGGYNEVFRNSQDFDLYLRLVECETFKLASIREPLTFLRWTPESLSHLGVEQRKYHLLACVAAEARRTLGTDPTAGERAAAFLEMFDAWYRNGREVRYARATQLRRRAIAAFGIGQILDSLWLIVQAVGLQPSWLWRGDRWDPAIAEQVLPGWQRLIGEALSAMRG